MFATGASEIAVEVMRLTSSGQLGIGTNAPATLLEVSYVMGTENCSVSVLSLEARDTGSSDVGAGAGPSIDFRIPSSTSATKISSRIAAIKQSGTDANDASHMVFYTSNSGSAATEKMRIDRQGNVGIGTTVPGVQLDIVDGTASVGVAFDSGGGAASVLFFRQTGTDLWNFQVAANSQALWYDYGDSSIAMHIDTGDTSWQSGSDERLKENIVDEKSRLSDLLQIKVRRFDWLNKKKKKPKL